jgi:hypothetical protein
MKPILTLIIIGFMVLLSGCVQPESGPQTKVMTASQEWKPDGFVQPNEYARSILLHAAASSGYSGGTLEISWKNDAEYLYMALNGSTKGWISLGFEPTEWMKDADIIMGAVDKGEAEIEDVFSTGNYGPHQKDTTLGGTYDILAFGGRESGGYTVIEFKRRMNTTDKFDKAFVPGQKVPIIWAMADTTSDEVKHNVAKGEGTLTLE